MSRLLNECFDINLSVKQEGLMVSLQAVNNKTPDLLNAIWMCISFHLN